MSQSDLASIISKGTGCGLRCLGWVIAAAIGGASIGYAEPDSSAPPVLAALDVECSVSGAHLVPVRAGVRLKLAQAGKAVIGTPGTFALSFLTMPGCKVEPILPPGSAQPSGFASVTGGATCFSMADFATSSALSTSKGRDSPWSR